MIFSLVTLVRGCIGLIWASAGPLIPLLMEAFGINRGTAGWFASAAPITIASVSLPFAIWGSRYSLKKTYMLGAFLQAGGVLVFFLDSYPWVIITRILFAAGTAITVPVAAAIATEWFSSKELPLLNGIQMSFVNITNATACVSTVPLATVLSWKAPIIAYGMFAMTCALAWAVFGKDKHTTQNPIKMEGLQKAPVQHRSIWRVLSRRSTLLLAFAVLGCWCLGNAIGSWLPSYYHEVFHMPLQKASSLLALITAGGTAACLAGGILPVRLGRRKPFLILCGAFMGIAAMASVLFNNMLVIYISIVMFGIFANIQTPSLFTIPMELPDTSIHEGVAILSVLQCGGNLGNFLAPLLVGYLADVTGSYLPGFFICAAFSLSMLAAGILLPETGPKGAAAMSRKTQTATET